MNRDERLMSVYAGMQQDLMEGTDPGALAGTVLKGIMEALSCSNGAVFLSGEDGSSLLFLSGFPDRPDKPLFTEEMPLFRRLSLLTEGFLTGNAEEGEWSDLLSPVPHGHSVLCVPVFSSGRAAGLLYADAQAHNFFNSDDLRFVQVSARTLSLSLEALHLRNELIAVNPRDALTGCLTRAKFDEDCEMELTCSERYGRPLSLLIMAIDAFSDYAAISAESGGLLLKKVGSMLAANIRVCDKAYRLTDEAFAVLLPGIDHERADFTARRLRKIISEKPFEGIAPGMEELKLTVSFGVASFPKNAVYTGGLIKSAESSLRHVQQTKTGG